MDSSEKIVKVLQALEKELGRKMLEETHFHVYPVDYTERGEKVHKAFGDKINREQLSLFDKCEEYMP